MRNTARLGLALLACLCSLSYIVPASADDGSTAPWAPLQPASKSKSFSGAGWNVHPVAKATTMVYEAYVDRTSCKTLSDSSPSFTGVSTPLGKGYAGDDNPLSSGHPINLNCPDGYTMVNTTSQTTGLFGDVIGVGGGQITNNNSAQCCPIKYRWAAPQVKA